MGTNRVMLADAALVFEGEQLRLGAPEGRPMPP